MSLVNKKEKLIQILQPGTWELLVLTRALDQLIFQRKPISFSRERSLRKRNKKRNKKRKKKRKKKRSQLMMTICSVMMSLPNKLQSQSLNQPSQRKKNQLLNQ
jgi:hypothetical protein